MMNMDKKEKLISLPEIAYVFRHFILWIVLAAVLFGVVGIVYNKWVNRNISSTLTFAYQARSEVYVTYDSGEAEPGENPVEREKNEIAMARAQAVNISDVYPTDTLIAQIRVYFDTHDELGSLDGYTDEQLRAMCESTVADDVNGTKSMKICFCFTAPSAEMALALEAASTANLQATLPQTIENCVLTPVATPTAATRTIVAGGSQSISILIAPVLFIVGGLLCAFVCYLVAMFTPTLKNKDVVLSLCDDDTLPLLNSFTGTEQDREEQLRARILARLPEGECPVIGVLHTGTCEAHTLPLSHLADSLAAPGRRVLLLQIFREGENVLPAGTHDSGTGKVCVETVFWSSPADELLSPAFAEELNEKKQNYDVVLLSFANADVYADALSAAPLMTTALFLAMPDDGKRALGRVADRMEEACVPMLGIAWVSLEKA